MQVSFATQSYKHPSLPISAQRCLNFYAERQPADAKSQITVLGVPGLTLLQAVGTGPVRGMHVMADVLYVVSGGTLYSVPKTGAATSLGGVIGGTNVVSMADNGTQLCIVNGTNGYIYSVTGGFQAITDANFHAANTVTFFDNYFVFDWAGTNKYFISAILDGTSYSGLDFASAEVQPQDVVSIVNQQENLLIFATGHIETWYDSGAVAFPFQRYDGATIERGCTGSYTPVKEDNSVFFLGDDLIFYRLNGIIPVRISTHALEYEWQTYTTTSDAYTFSYTWGGHKFIVLTFPMMLKTFVFDISTNLWHERESWDKNNQTLGRWRGNCHVSFFGLELIGDAINGNIGYLNESEYTEYGNVIPGQLVAPPIHSDRKRVFHSRFELDMETGVGAIGPTSSGLDQYTALLLHMDGTNGSTTFTDSSFASNPVTTIGAAQVSSTQIKFGTGSGSFNGASAGLSVSGTTPLQLNGDFTIDLWVYTTALTGGPQRVINKDLLTTAAGPYGITITAAGLFNFFSSSDGVSNNIASGTATGAIIGTATLNTWVHAAVVRQGNTWYLFNNGTLTNSFSSTLTPIMSSDPVFIGMRNDNARFFNGFIDELRLSNIARWTTNFTPPTAPYSITPGVGVDPQAMLDWSDDGGHTFTPQQIWHSMGRTGEYKRRLRWLRLGQARQRVYRLSISDPVKRVIIAAHADLTVGM